MADEVSTSSSSTLNPTLLKYQENPIYRGLTSLVYQGTYNDTVPVAVKIMPSSAENLFNSEVELLKRLQHPNIVKYVGMIKNESEYKIVTEFMPGGTLKALLDTRRYDSNPLPLRQGIDYALDIARAMEFLHNQKIIHRDLKPHNVLLTESQDRAVLIDFGLSRQEDVNGMTVGVGTVSFMAPEVIRDPNGNWERELPYDHKIDVYSFSIVLWQLITSKTPYLEQKLEILDICEGVRVNELRPSMKGVTIPLELSMLLGSCWETDPAARPEFSDIRSRLERILLNFREPRGDEDQDDDASSSDQDKEQAKKKDRGSEILKRCFCPTVFRIKYFFC